MFAVAELDLEIQFQQISELRLRSSPRKFGEPFRMKVCASQMPGRNRLQNVLIAYVAPYAAQKDFGSTCGCDCICAVAQERIAVGVGMLPPNGGPRTRRCPDS